MNNQKIKVDFDQVINNLIDEYRQNPIKLTKKNEDFIHYLILHRSTYVRTIKDILCHAPSIEKPLRVLEIGGFTGIVSICLSRLGYQVVFSDIPEFLESEELKKKLSENNIDFFSHNLLNLPIPQPNNSFDVIIMCEVLEHLNFNHLPVISEINRILKIGGLLYLSLPNIASLENRVRLLKGDSIHNPISHLIANLDPESTAKVGLHWREYTKQEVAKMLSIFGFSIKEHYFFDASKDQTKDLPRSSLFRVKRQIKQTLLNLFPSLKWNQTAIALKATDASSLDDLYPFLEDQKLLNNSYE